MANGLSEGDAATDLGDDNRRVPRERHKRLLESALDASKFLVSQQNISSINEVLEPQQQRFDASDASDNISSGINQQVVVVVKDSSRFTSSSSGDDCEEEGNDADDDDEDDPDSCELLDETALDEAQDNVIISNISGGLASVNVNLSVVPTNVTSLSDYSVPGDADVGSVEEEASERMLVREKDKSRKMGKVGCIKKKIEKVITAAVVCGELREVGKEEQQEANEEEGSAQGRVTTGRLQGNPLKGQVRSAEDTLVGPCGKKRCADRYDSSESSDRLFYFHHDPPMLLRLWSHLTTRMTNFFQVALGPNQPCWLL